MNVSCFGIQLEFIVAGNAREPPSAIVAANVWPNTGAFRLFESFFPPTAGDYVVSTAVRWQKFIGSIEN